MVQDLLIRFREVRQSAEAVLLLVDSSILSAKSMAIDQRAEATRLVGRANSICSLSTGDFLESSCSEEAGVVAMLGELTRPSSTQRNEY